MTAVDPAVLARPGGGYAMLAVDQREALRAMFAAHQSAPVTDAQLRDFKVTATRILTPHASAVLIDKQFAFDAAVREHAVDPSCALIAAADHFVAGNGEFVTDAVIDRAVDPAAVKAQGAVAMKLLVVWRPDGDPQARVEMVAEFAQRCRAAGLVSIIEPICKAPRDGRPYDGDVDWNAAVLAAAEELGAVGADLYKAEVPFHGEGDEQRVRAGCRRITESVAGPWVVLSSGVRDDVFPTAVRWACQEGASGFLAGRAVWASVIGSPDLERALREVSIPRLQLLASIVDEEVST